MEGSDEACLHNFFGNVLVPKVSASLTGDQLEGGGGGVAADSPCSVPGR